MGRRRSSARVASAFLRPGDRVVQPAATFYLYELVSVARGARVHRVPMRGQSLDLEALATVAGEVEARIVWICDPNNPTGTALQQGEVGRVPRPLCPRAASSSPTRPTPTTWNPSVAYAASATSRPGALSSCYASFSKFYGLAGLRLGYAVVDEALAAYLSVVEEPCNVNCAALAAGMASLRATEAAAERRREVAEARTLLERELRDAGVEPYPSEASFVLARVDGDDELLAREMARGGVLVRAGSEIGLPGHLRVTVGPTPLMELAGGELRRALTAVRT